MSVSKHGLSNDLSLGTAIGSGLTLFGLPLCESCFFGDNPDTIKLFRTKRNNSDRKINAAARKYKHDGAPDNVRMRFF